MIKGIEKLKSILQKLNVRSSVINGMDGREENLSEATTFVPGPYLHKDDHSAKFELENQDLFNYLRDIKSRIDRSLL